MVRVVQNQHGDPWKRLAWDSGIAGLTISLTDKGKWTIVGESYFDFPLSFGVEEIPSLEGVSWRSYSASPWQQPVHLLETVLIPVWTWRMESFWDEAMCHGHETQGVGMLHDYAS